MFSSILILIGLTLIPGLELRASIPAGILGNQLLPTPLPWPMVVLICTLANIALGMGLFSLLDLLIRLTRRIPWCDRYLHRFLDRAQEKLATGVQKYGFWGLAIFIGIPLPLTGAYTGAAGAYAMGMKKREFYLANLTGVCIASLLVTLLSLLLKAGVNLPFINHLLKSI